MADRPIGTWDDVFGSSDAQTREIAMALRAVILRLHPASVEVARPGDRAVSFGFGPKKMSEAYAYLMPWPGRVNLGFYRGAALPDPGGFLEGTGKSLRHVKVREMDMADAPGLAALVAVSQEERRLALGLQGSGLSPIRCDSITR